MTTTIIRLRKENMEVVLTQNNSDLGGKSYHLQVNRICEGCEPKLEKYRRLNGAKTANALYIQYKQMGYIVVEHNTFRNEEMDNR